MSPGFDSWLRGLLWVDFIAASFQSSEEFFSAGYGAKDFTSSPSKFQFDLDRGPLGRILLK